MTMIYKVLEPVEIGDKTYRRGEEVALRAREAEKLLKEKKVGDGKTGFPGSTAADQKKAAAKLAPREPEKKDAAKVKEATKRATAKNKALKTAAKKRTATKNKVAKTAKRKAAKKKK